MGKLSKRIAALQAELRKRALRWGEADDDACAAAIRDIVAGRPPSKRMRPIVARRAERAGAEIRELLDAAMASVQGPPPDEEQTGDSVDPDPEQQRPTRDVKEYFDELERG